MGMKKKDFIDLLGKRCNTNRLGMKVYYEDSSQLGGKVKTIYCYYYKGRHVGTWVNTNVFYFFNQAFIDTLELKNG